MSLAKGDVAITQLVATGNSTELDVSGANSATVGLSHSNGSGSVTAPGQALVQWKPAGGARYYDLMPVRFSLVAGQTDTRTVAVPAEAGRVRVAYTAPTGPTGMTLDAEAATLTA